MNILNQSQITEIVTKRSIYHTLEHGGKLYERIETFSSYVPYKGCDVVTTSKVKWKVYVEIRTIKELKKKEVKELGLNELFDNQPIQHINGNITEYSERFF